MSWNFRLCKTVDENQFTIYSIKEVYYNKANNDDTIWAVSSESTGIDIDDHPDYLCRDFNPIKEIESILDQMKIALQKPIIDLDNITFVNHIEKE